MQSWTRNGGWFSVWACCTRLWQGIFGQGLLRRKELLNGVRLVAFIGKRDVAEADFAAYLVNRELQSLWLVL